MTPRLKLLFTLSICVNILLIGIIVGHSYNRMSSRHGSHFKELQNSLPKDKAQLFKDTMRDIRKKSRSIKKNINATQKQMIDVLIAPEFDEAEYQRLSDIINRQRTELLTGLSSNTKILASKFTQDERKALAKRLQRSMKGGIRNRKHERSRSRNQDQQRPNRQQNNK